MQGWHKILGNYVQTRQINNKAAWFPTLNCNTINGYITTKAEPLSLQYFAIFCSTSHYKPILKLLRGKADTSDAHQPRWPGVAWCRMVPHGAAKQQRDEKAQGGLFQLGHLSFILRHRDHRSNFFVGPAAHGFPKKGWYITPITRTYGRYICS